ncbi:MAG: hypothetical protein AABY48_01495 [Nitrospirota bacterium]|jgi:hypothetical protein
MSIKGCRILLRPEESCQGAGRTDSGIQAEDYKEVTPVLGAGREAKKVTLRDPGKASVP